LIVGQFKGYFEGVGELKNSLTSYLNQIGGADVEKNKVYVVVKCFQGIVEDVELCATEEQAERVFGEFTDIEYANIEFIHENYAGTSIFVCELPKMEGVL
jgi:hypothetical protein